MEPTEIERTFVMLKPEALQRALVGTLIQKLEQTGMKLLGLWMDTLQPEQVNELYPNLREWEDYADYRKHLCSGPSIFMIWEGRNAILVVRKLVGYSSPAMSGPETLRAQYALDSQRNLIHASSDRENAEFEVSRWSLRLCAWKQQNISSIDRGGK